MHRLDPVQAHAVCAATSARLIRAGVPLRALHVEPRPEGLLVVADVAPYPALAVLVRPFQPITYDALAEEFLGEWGSGGVRAGSLATVGAML